ncbi:MAG: MBL fold metallo-hydrolase [bacterium]|nr:MBL fold metallo-hydrolase [bacterium]
MRRAWAVALTVLLGFAGVSAIAGELRVTAVGNAGVLLEAGGRRVLIDGLYRAGVSPYLRVPAHKQKALEAAREPFDAIDLILATHHHADHFDAGAVAAYLGSSPKTVFFSTPQAVDRLKRTVEEFESIADRVRSRLPAEGRRSISDMDGIRLHLLNLHHGRGGETPVQNLGFLVEIGDFRVLHVGDTEVDRTELEAHDLAQFDIDVAVVGYWNLQDRERRSLYRETVRPETFLAVHVPGSEAPPEYFGSARDAATMRSRVRQAVPEAVFLAPGEVHRLRRSSEP